MIWKVLHLLVVGAGVIQLIQWATSGLAWALNEATRDLGQGGG
jgi:hypothetical protein